MAVMLLILNRTMCQRNQLNAILQKAAISTKSCDQTKNGNVFDKLTSMNKKTDNDLLEKIRLSSPGRKTIAHRKKELDLEATFDDKKSTKKKNSKRILFL